MRARNGGKDAGLRHGVTSRRATERRFVTGYVTDVTELATGRGRGFEDRGEGREVSSGAENCSDSVQSAGHQVTLGDASATPLATTVADGMTWAEEVAAVCADIRERGVEELARALEGFLVALGAAIQRGDHRRASALLEKLTTVMTRDA